MLGDTTFLRVVQLNLIVYNYQIGEAVMNEIKTAILGVTARLNPTLPEF